MALLLLYIYKSKLVHNDVSKTLFLCIVIMMSSTQSKALDAVLLGACKKILSCSSKTCNEAVWGDLGVEPLALRRAKSKVV